MTSVVDVDASKLTEPDPIGYLRYALGPPRLAPKEGKGWLFAAGELAMTATDLAKWNIAVMNRRILSPASWNEMETEIRLKNGVGTQYGLGIGVTSRDGHRALTHGGEVSGFTAVNTVFPDDRAAVTVLTNQDSASAAEGIAKRIGPLLFSSRGADFDAEGRARTILENANAYFTPEALRDVAASLGPLGEIRKVERTAQRERGGMIFRGFEVQFATRTVALLERDMPDGKIEQFQVAAKD
jgi:CubicO group peptidase (beta-lactamase class C family)